MKTPITDSAISRIEKAHTKSGANVTTKYKAAFADLGNEMRELEKKLSVRFLSDDPAGDWTEDFAHENGNYMCGCVKCGKRFLGHKRRCVCKVCSSREKTQNNSFDEWWTLEGQYNIVHKSMKDFAECVWKVAIKNNKI